MKHNKSENPIAWFFKDSHGKWAIIELPNVLLWAWIVLLVVGLFLSESHLKYSLHLLQSTILFAWAYLELTWGTSRFRQVLGGIFILVVIVGYLN